MSLKSWLSQVEKYSLKEYVDSSNVVNATKLAEDYANEYLDDEEIPEEVFDECALFAERVTKTYGLNR